MTCTPIQGEVVLSIRRKMPSMESMPPPSTGGGQQQFHPQQQQQGGAPLVGGLDDQRFPEAPKGVRDVLINRPNEQTSFGFVLQSNTLRAGCMICEYRISAKIKLLSFVSHVYSVYNQ